MSYRGGLVSLCSTENGMAGFASSGRSNVVEIGDLKGRVRSHERTFRNGLVAYALPLSRSKTRLAGLLAAHGYPANNE